MMYQQHKEEKKTRNVGKKSPFVLDNSSALGHLYFPPLMICSTYRAFVKTVSAFSLVALKWQNIILSEIQNLTQHFDFLSYLSTFRVENIHEQESGRSKAEKNIHN